MPCGRSYRSEVAVMTEMFGAKNPAPKDAARSIGREVREWIVAIALALLAAVLIRAFLFTLIRVDGQSMNPALADGERLFVTVADVKLHGAERGDVVICRYPDRGQTYFVKRVVAAPGDTVYREDGVTHVVYSIPGDNGVEIVDEPLDPEYARTSSQFSGDIDPYLLGEDEYFVVGDNRYHSHDSRDWDGVGPIAGEILVGRVRQVIWPLNHFRTVQ